MTETASAAAVVDAAPSVQRVETWIDIDGRSLWGAVHRPGSGRVNGVAVIAGPMGLESVTVHRMMLRTATELAQRGIATVRFSWTGDGDSSLMPADADPAELWRADLGAVVDLARELAPGAPVHLLAIRLGTTIDPARPVDTVTHIEPIGGRAWLRAHKMLRTMGTDVPVVPGDSGTEVNGALWSPDQAKSIGRLKALTAVGDATATSVPVPDDEMLSFYSVAPQLATVPVTAVLHAVEPLPRTETYAQAPWTPRTTATFRVEDVEITEELTTLPGCGLPAVVTRPATEPTSSVALTAPGAEPRHAPIGLFTLAARHAAARGAVVVRADRHGLGELASTTDTHAPNVYSEQAVADAAATVDAAREKAPGRPVIAVGPCIGAWVLLRAADRTPIDRLLALEAIAWDPDPTHFDFIPGTVEVAYGGKRFAAGLRTPPSLDAMSRRDQLVHQGVQVAKRAAKAGITLGIRHCPAPVWRALGRRGLVQDPAMMMAALPEQGRVDVYLGDFGASIFERSRGPQAAAAARARGRDLHVHVDSRLDHSLFSQSARTEIVALVGQAVDEASAA